MSPLFITIAILTVFLIIIGATQRKELILLFRSEAHDIVVKNTDSVKVAKLQLSDMKAKIKQLINQAGELFALEEQQRKEAVTTQESIDKLLKEAKAAKEDNNIILAKEKLKLKLENEKQLTLINENIETLALSRGKVEGNIQKVKTYVAKNNIRVKGAEARKQVNNLLQASNITSIDGETLEETIDTLEIKVEGEEAKLDYIDKINDNGPEEYSEVVDKEFENL